MKKNNFVKFFVGFLILSFSVSTVIAQKKRPPVKAKAKPIIFAVLNDGGTLEPIAFIEKGKLAQAASSDDGNTGTTFTNTYYKTKPVYRLIFGGVDDGTATIKSFDPKAECSAFMAQITAQPTKAKLKGMVMALATDAPTKKTKGVRRPPTATERAEIETIVRAELIKQGVSTNAAKNLKYYNLTALDVDADGKAEMVGSYWAETSPKERNLLFFIAEKSAGGKYELGYSDYSKVTPAEIMSGEMKDLDELGGELLLDVLEYNGDSTAEIFTINRAFEGNNFQVYSRQDGKWMKVFEGYNYHCAY